MIDSIRSRLTLWYVTVLAGVLAAFGLLVYVLMHRALHERVDATLHSLLGITAISLTHDAAEGQTVSDAARSTVAELSGPQQGLALYDGSGALLASGGWDEDFTPALPAPPQVPGTSVLSTQPERDGDDRWRVAIRQLDLPASGRTYFAVAGEPLDTVEAELASLRRILWYSIPLGLVAAALGGWFLARKSLAPVVAMAARAEEMGAGNLAGRLPVANPRDELGRLAETFNGLLGRLGAAFAQQQRFMADASHELRTPIATAGTAAAVLLQQPHREEAEYRHALQIVSTQTDRLSRIVDDMLTLARVDAGEYPIRREPLYLNELVDDVAREARVLSERVGVHIDVAGAPEAPYVGDEHLLKRLVLNLLDNAVRYTPSGGVVRLMLTSHEQGYALTVSDNGGGIPPASQRHIFDRFFRADVTRTRREDRGAGLGLPIAKWIAEAHDGTLELLGSSPGGTAFRATLP
jgi:heavy metal sensor kinase